MDMKRTQHTFMGMEVGNMAGVNFMDTTIFMAE
jgi:hypothetical protein